MKTKLILSAILAFALGLAWLHAQYLHPLLWEHGSSSALDASIGIFVLLGMWSALVAFLLWMEFVNPVAKGRA